MISPRADAVNLTASSKPQAARTGDGVAIVAPQDTLAQPTAADDLALLESLQRKQFRLTERQKFPIPFIRKAEVDVSPETMLRDLDKNPTAVRLGVPGGASLSISHADLPILHAMYGATGLASLAHPTAAAAFLALEKAGWRFARGGSSSDSIGAFGAYRTMESGGVAATSPDEETVRIHSDEDAARLRYFGADGVSDGLSDAVHAAALKQLAADDRSLYLDDQPVSAQAAYATLYQERAPHALWVGTHEVPLVRLADGAIDAPDEVVRSYRAARGQFDRLGKISADQKAAWALISEPVGTTDLPTRRKWLERIDKLNDGRPLETYRQLVGLGPDVDTAIQRYGDCLDLVDRGAMDATVFAMHSLSSTRCGLDADEKFKHFKSLLKSLPVKDAISIWQKVDDASPGDVEGRAELAAMLAAEGDSGAEVTRNLETVTKHLKEGERLKDVGQQFLDVRNGVMSYGDSKDVEPTFNFVRDVVPATTPPGMKVEAARAQFLKLLDDFGEATDIWKTVCTEPGAKTPSPPSSQKELVDRLAAFRVLYENANDVDSAVKDYADVAARRQGGESLSDLATVFVDVAGYTSGNKARVDDAFDFAQVGVSKTAPDVPPAQARSLFMRWLSSVGDFDTARESWGNLVKLVGPEELPALIDVASREVRDSDASTVAETLAGVVPLRVKGESTKDVVNTYNELNECLGDDEQTRKAMRFMRDDLANRPWPSGGRSAPDAFATLLRQTGDFERAQEIWKKLGADDAKLPEDLAQRLDTFSAMCDTAGDVDQAFTDYQRIANQDDGRPFTQRVAEYERVCSADDDGTGEDAWDWMKKLTPDQRAPYLGLLEATRSFSAARDGWDDMRRITDSGTSTKRPLDLDLDSVIARAQVLTDLVKDHRLDSSSAVEVLQTLLKSKKTDQSLAQAYQAYAPFLEAIGNDADNLSEASSAFSFAQDHVGAAQQPVFARLLEKFNARDAQKVWTDLRKVGTESGLPARVGSVLERGDWDDTVEHVQDVVKSMPSGVDADRAALAMLSLREPGAINEVRDRLDKMDGDRTEALEALCALVNAAPDDSALKEAWDEVTRAGAPGTRLERTRAQTRELRDNAF